jgi:hypothetical protein
MMHGAYNIVFSLVHILSIYLACGKPRADNVCRKLIVFSIPSGIQETQHICMRIVCEHTSISRQTLTKLVCYLYTNTSWHMMFGGVDEPLYRIHTKECCGFKS